jgi:hypothetical protein
LVCKKIFFSFLQILLMLQFLGANSFYHTLRDCKGASIGTVSAVVKQVCNSLFALQQEVIKWPEAEEACVQISRKFESIAGFPFVVGAIDGTHVRVCPPKAVEWMYCDRHNVHSLNVQAVAGPDLQFLYAVANSPGRLHDSRALELSSLWADFELRGWRPFPNSYLIGDSGYGVKNWLLTPFSGDVQGSRLAYNKAHSRTRVRVECAFGVLKKRFYTLSTGLRVRDMEVAAKMVIAAMVCHNLCVDAGDHGEDFDEAAFPQPGNPDGGVPPRPETLRAQRELDERRRNEILQQFF